MSRPQIIHSGHFMVSEPHTDPEPEPGGRAALRAAAGAGEPGAGAGGRREGAGPGAAAGYDFDTVNACTCRTYRYGPRSSGALSIDASLTKLFECMTLAYSGKIVSPKWKTFKGLKLLQRDKIRLNNAIWRAWYLQYVERRKNPVCSFVTPLECSEGDDHRNPEAVIMEGKYWKRQIGVVIREYHKWRTYFCTRVQKKREKPVSSSTQQVADSVQSKGLSIEAEGGCPMELDLDTLDSFISDLADTLFYSRSPYGGPNPRGLAHQGNADMIQPSLTQLHPNFGEDYFMDTLDSIHEGNPVNSFLGASSPSLQQLSCASVASSSSDSLKLFLSVAHVAAAKKDFFAVCHVQPSTQASLLLPAAAPLGSLPSVCDPDVTSSSKELPLPGDSLSPLPFPLELESLTPLNGQQTFLPLFPTSPLRVSPPLPGPPTLHHQPTLDFSITHTAAEKPPSPTLSGDVQHPPSSRDTFAIPMSGPPPRGGRCRRLQHIAPARPSSHPPVVLARLVVAGPSPQPLAPVRNSSQICAPLEFPASVLLMEKSSHPCSAAVSSTGAKAEDRAERRGRFAPCQPHSFPSTKGSRRACLTSADYARRTNISCAFDTLASLVLPGPAQPSVKLSKAMLLQKSVEYVGWLQQERRQAQEVARSLRSEIEELTTAIGDFQRQLPPSGAPVAPPRSDHTTQLYDDYVRERTLQDWRFWLFSVLIKPLFESYRGAVSTSSAKDFCQSVLDWLERHCALPMLRPAISSSLLQLSKFTAILTQPSRLPEQALQAVCRSPHGKGHS